MQTDHETVFQGLLRTQVMLLGDSVKDAAYVTLEIGRQDMNLSEALLCLLVFTDYLRLIGKSARSQCAIRLWSKGNGVSGLIIPVGGFMVGVRLR
jgi:hypothetical protein